MGVTTVIEKLQDKQRTRSLEQAFELERILRWLRK